MKSLKKMLFVVTIATILTLLTACGGSDAINAPTNGQPLYSVGGTVTGLNDNVTLVLQNNGGNTRTINGNGTVQSFTFTGLANGAMYSVSVLTQPQGQTCAVSNNGTGTIRSANVTNVQVVCTNNTGVTLSGKIKVPDGVVIDGSVNDCNEDYNNNETIETAQILPNPISVGGYVRRYQQFVNNGCSYSPSNPNDYYQVQLKAGDIITLAIGESNTRNNNLYLYLCEYNSNLCDESRGTGTYRILTAPSDGTYYVRVNAYSGASNYILTIGADMDTAALAYADTGVLSTQHEMVPGQVIVRFKDTVKTTSSTDRTVTQYADMGLTAVAGSPERTMLFTIDDTKFQIYANNIYANNTEDADPKLYERVTAGDPEKTRLLNTLLAVEELRYQPDILYAEPNYIVHTNSKIPDDKYYGGYQWNLPMIGLPEAWDETTGSDDIIVAVVDSGVLMNHPDLSGRLTNTGYKFLNSGKDIGADPGDPGGKESQTNGSSFHGTHVAGIIAARTNNNLGVAGVTWNTKVMPVRVIGAGGSGTSYDMQQGIRYAAGLSNDSGIILPEASRANIINLSLGSTKKLPIEQELFNEVRAKGIIVVAAAGNENSATPSYPASYEGVISVSAVNINGTRASYSNYGSNTNFIDVAAPGGDSGDLNGDGYPDYILSTGGDDTSGSIKYDVYTLKAGTSMAAPHVAGVAALMKAVYKDFTTDEFKLLLEAGEITDITGDGDSRYYGNGLINAFKAVAAVSKLAGGVEIYGLDVNPRTVNFGAVSSDMSVTVSKIGTGAATVTFSKNVDWLTVTPSAVDGSGLGSYNLHVDRSGLTQEGAYTDVVTFIASNGKTVSVSVTVQVRGETKVTYDAGVHYILLYRINDDGTSELVDVYDFSNGYLYGVKASGGYYDYKFTNVPPGNYLIIAGSDRNKDLQIGDGGEALGAYPTLEQIVLIEVTDSNIPNLDFTTNLVLSISSTTMAFGDMSAIDKPAAILPEFKRFLNIEANKKLLLWEQK